MYSLRWTQHSACQNTTPGRPRNGQVLVTFRQFHETGRHFSVGFIVLVISREPLIRVTRDFVCIGTWPLNKKKVWSQILDFQENDFRFYFLISCEAFSRSSMIFKTMAILLNLSSVSVKRRYKLCWELFNDFQMYRPTFIIRTYVLVTLGWIR